MEDLEGMPVGKLEKISSRSCPHKQEQNNNWKLWTPPRNNYPQCHLVTELHNDTIHMLLIQHLKIQQEQATFYARLSVLLLEEKLVNKYKWKIQIVINPAVPEAHVH